MAVRAPQLPGWGLSASVTTLWLGALALLPMLALAVQAAQVPAERWLQVLGQPRVVAALGLSFASALLAALLSTLAGLLIAWVLVRYAFAGRWLMDAVVDLPFALPTAVAGIALTALWGPEGFLGRLCMAVFGVQVAFTRVGVVLALVFIGLPFVVRTVQPVLADLDGAVEEAAACLGASPFQVLTKVVLPPLRPALLTGFALAFARGVGEFGSVVFIAGNLPGRTEIAPLLIVTRLEEYDYAGAAVLASVLLGGSLVLLGLLTRLQGRAGQA